VRAAVVGGGVSGLTCAYRLRQDGHEVTVFERASVPGGRMATVQAGGFSIDVGAIVMLDNYDRLKALASELGLGGAWMTLESGPGGILEDHEVLPFAPSSAFDLFRYRGLSLRSRLRLVAYFLRALEQESGLDFFDLSRGDDTSDAVDAWTGTAALCGEDVARHLVDPFVRTFHFHSATKLSMKYFHALATLLLERHGFSTHAFRGFMGSLPRELARHLDVRVGSDVTAVVPANGRVRVAHAGGSELFDVAVVATTATTARRLLVEPTEAQGALLGAVAYSSTILCSFRAPRDAAGDFEGIWVPYSESAIVCDCANETCKGSADEHDCVLTIGTHEEAARELMDLPDDRVLRLVASEWGRLSPGVRGRLDGLHVQRWPEALPVYGVGHVTRVKRFLDGGQGAHGIWLCGDYLNHPWLEGSVRCGEEVAAGIRAGAATVARRGMAGS
jgi:oxygen-dependent protoporphyrinogen oxidase